MVFEQLISPLSEFFQTRSAKIDESADSRSLFFKDFTLSIIYGLTIRVGSLRKLSKELFTNPDAKKLSLKQIPFSTLRDGFKRFNVMIFSDLYDILLNSIDWLEVPELSHLGILKAVDGSLFPTILSMDWASYKKKKKALRLHLAFNLNQICPSEFVIQAANSSERSFLKSIIEQGVTYIADRGYFAFDLIAEIVNKSAFFVFRIKDKIRFVSTESLALTGKIPICFDNVQDDLVRFTNDKSGLIYRIVRFRVWKSYFVLVTNRLDLTTLQVILMYAYRWQIELLFKVIKRTLNGIHLMVQNEKGVKVYFYLLMICCLLQIKLKQDLQKFSIKKKKNEKTKTITSQNPDVWINNINQIFNQGLKISSDWLLYLKNYIGQDIDIQIIDIFNSA
jgi:hypothetical protein